MWQHTLVAATLAAASLYQPTRVQALDVPERFQFVVYAVGWQDADIPTLADVVTCESGWNALAVSPAGDLGLMQINPRTWESTRAIDPDAPDVWAYWSNPAANLYVGRIIHDAQGWGPWGCNRAP